MVDFTTHLLVAIRWLRPWRDQAIARHLEEVLSLPLACRAFADPERDVPNLVLQRLRMLANGGIFFRTPIRFVHPVHQALNELVAEGEPFTTEVHLGEIRGIIATKGGTGRTGLSMNLDRLPETMGLMKGESFGPLSEAEMDRLRAAVHRELPTYGGALSLDLQTWDGTYIVGNTGASRRFALLRRLSRHECFPARVTPLHLSMDALHLLREQWRIVVLTECSGLLGAINRLSDLCGDLFWTAHGDRQEQVMLLALPYPHRAGPRFVGPLGRLHRLFDDIGAFDVGRYLTEQISVARQRETEAIQDRA